MIVDLYHTADKNLMVAAIMTRMRPTFKDRAGVRHDRNASYPGKRRHAIPFFTFGLGELVRQDFLFLVENVDRVTVYLLPDRKCERLAMNAEQNQGRIERHGVERTHRHADARAIGCKSRDDDDAGRKSPEGIAQTAGIERHVATSAGYANIH